MSSQSILEDTSISPITAGGERLKEFLDGSHVETEWIAGYHVIWQTGQRNGPWQGDLAHHTHCSAYAAAVALGLDIYLLRPPHHGQAQLANAQVEWLGGSSHYSRPSALESGWSALGKSGDHGVLDNAVSAANAGKLVLGGYLQPPTTDSNGNPIQEAGHIVVVRSQVSKFSDQGPQVVSAGVRNYLSISMKEAFGNHPLAWPDQIQLFVRDTDLE